MNKLTATLAIVVLILLAAVAMLSKDKSRLHEDLIGQTEKYEQLSDYAAKLKVEYKSQADLKAEVEKRFKNEMSAMEKRIEILSDATFLIKEKARESNNSDVVFNGENSQFVLNEIRFENGPPVGYVLIFKDGRVVSKLYTNQIKVGTVVSKDEDSGRYSIISKADYVLKSPSLNSGGVSWFNKPYPLKITEGTAIIDPTERNQLVKQFYLWNPKINLNVNTNGSKTLPGMGVSLGSYGFTKNDSEFKFVQLGFQVDEKVLRPTLAPILWRPLNLLPNTYLGPSLVYENGGIGYYLGIQVGL